MDIDAIKQRQVEVRDLLSVLTDRTSKYVALKNSATNEVKLYTADVELERKKSLKGEPHNTAGAIDKLTKAKHDLDVANAHLSDMSLSDADKARMAEVKKKLEELKTNRKDSVIERNREYTALVSELNGIEARDTGKNLSERTIKLHEELDRLNKAESKYGIYRNQCEHEIINRIDNLFAGLYRDAVSFSDTEYFFKQVATACEARVKT